MRFSLEELYYQFGQYDKIVGISFGFNTESFQKFGGFIVGQLIYSAQVRAEFENKLQLNPVPRTSGFQRFRENINKISKDKISELEKTGFDCTDVIDVLHQNIDYKNRFTSSETRELPESIKIKVSPLKSGEELANMIIYLKEAMLKHNEILCPFEWDQYHGALYYKFKDKLPDKLKEMIYDANGKMSDEINYEYLDIKFESDELKDRKEIEEYHKLFEDIIRKRVEIIQNELKRASEKVKDLPAKYPEEFKYIYSFAVFFRPERLIFGEFAVYLDFERFVHIYLGHVAETLIGERHENNTLFQYKLKDIKRLIKLIIDKLSDEIQDHFRENPGKDFNRQGSRSVYF